MTIIHVALLLGWLLSVAAGLSGLPLICATDPPIAVDAGSNLSATIDNPMGARCKATLAFANSSFLPLTWRFSNAHCAGLELARFAIPETVPNGDAFVFWQCAGEGLNTCNHLNISNGLGNMDSDPSEQDGEVGCVFDIQQTTTILVTRTISSSTLVETMSSVLTLATTSFMSINPPGSATSGGTASQTQTPDLTTTNTSLAVVPVSWSSNATSTPPNSALSSGSITPSSLESTRTDSVDGCGLSTSLLTTTRTVTVTN